MSKTVNMEVIKGFAGLNKKALLSVEPKELKDIKKTLESGLKDIKDTKLTKLVNTRISWIDAHMEEVENSLLAGMFEDEETEKNEAENEISLDMEDKKEDLKKVSSSKKVIKPSNKTNKTTKSTNTDKTPDKTKQVENKPDKAPENKPVKTPDKAPVKKALNYKDVPDIQPTTSVYVAIDDLEESVLKIIYTDKEENVIVLRDTRGVIECKYDKFVDKQRVEYYIGKTRHIFDILEMYTVAK